MAPLPVVKPRTPLIVVEDEHPYDVAASTPLPATPPNTTAYAPTKVPAALAKPCGNVGWGRFPGPVAQSVTAYCSARCRIEGEESELTWTHWVHCLRSEGEPIELHPSPQPRPSKLTMIRCPYCEASTHIALDDCWDLNQKFPPRQNTPNRPPISSTMSMPCCDRMDKDSEEGSSFSGYHRPWFTRGRNTAGNPGEGCEIPQMGGNVGGGGDRRDSNPYSDSNNSNSPPFDQCQILGSCKDPWDEARKVK